jgi:hypothetical protein
LRLLQEELEGNPKYRPIIRDHWVHGTTTFGQGETLGSTVYVALRYVADGYDLPKGVFNSVEAAKAYAARALKESHDFDGKLEWRGTEKDDYVAISTQSFPGGPHHIFVMDMEVIE